MASSLLEISLLEWLGKFNNHSLSCASLSDLYDGVLINAFINQYLVEEANLDAPPCANEWLVMKEFWLGVLNRLARFVVKNMGSIHSSVEEQMGEFESEVDVEALARGSNPAAVKALLELVLACGVHCKLKENCVFQVLQLRKDQQQVMMESIQRFKSKHLKARVVVASSSTTAPAAHADYRERYHQLKQAKDQLQTQFQSAQKSNSILSERNGELATLVTQLEAQLETVTSDYKSVKLELDSMTEKQNSAKTEEVDLASPMRFVASSKVASEENTQLRATIGAHEKTIASLQQKLSSLSPYVSRVRELEDEVEMLKEKSRSADQLERTNRKLEAKTIELANAMNRVKVLESQLDALAKSSAEYEHVAKQVPQLKTKLDQYKTELVALHSKITDASVLDSQSIDTKALTDKLQMATIQLEHQTSIISSLEREKEELLSALRTRPIAPSSSSGTAPLVSKTSPGQLNVASSSLGNQKMSLASENRNTFQQQLRGGRGRETVDQLEKELSSTKEEKESLRLDLEDKLDTMERLKEKFQGDYVATVAQLREARAELAQKDEASLLAQAKAQEMSVLLKATEARMSVLSEECGALKHECACLKAEREDWKAKSSETLAENAGLRAEVAKVSKALTQLESSSANDKAQLNSKLKQQQAKSEQFEEDMRRLSAEVTVLKTDLEESHCKLETLSAELATQQDVVQSLSAELDEVKHEKAQVEGDLANLELESASLEETLKTFMDRELTVVERSHALENEVLNLQALVESRDAELTVMQEELEKARLNDELIAVIKALRTQLTAQNKQIALHKEELRAVVTSYHKMGMELLQFKIGGLPQPTDLSTGTAPHASIKTTASGWGSMKEAQKTTPSKRIPLKDKSNLPLGQIPNGVCADTNNKTRRMTMAQRALETRPRGSLAAIALSKR
jgi:chromosome segregation ATPase